ncbi:DUF2797 domain-containing protein [Streptomyces atratus]|uniref:DUF2797 domain-containing protein n=1 Tax=Streptomyces atratus TaxID=1893 RepID=UPI001160F0C3|nr:DUF2797 domain-containing protein [Streptomyces atratus]
MFDVSAAVVSAHAAVVFGVVNVALAAHLSDRQAWQRMPEFIKAFADASFLHKGSLSACFEP